MEAMAELQGQVVVVIGGSSGMGLETARRARSEGADVILTGRDAGRLEAAAADVGARDTAAFDATDAGALDRFFDGLPATIDHIMLTGGGPYYAPLAELDHARAAEDFDRHIWLPVALAQHAVGRGRAGGTLLFIGGPGARRPGPGLALIGAATTGMPTLVANLAVELAPIRVNALAPGTIDTGAYDALGDGKAALFARRSAANPARRIGTAEDVAAAALAVLTNGFLTGVSLPVDGGEHLV